MNNSCALILFFLSSSIIAMQAPVDGKLYAKDFEKLGVLYTNKLIVSERIIIPFILDPCPGYETVSNIKRFNHAVATGYEVPLYVKYVNAKVGYGTFADALIKENDIVGEYTGHLIDQETALRVPHEKRIYFTTSHNCYAMPNYPEPLLIDAMSAGNFTRFVNHSYRPNIDTKPVYDGALWHVLYTAAKNIARDEQLLVNYGENYWKAAGITPIDADQI